MERNLLATASVSSQTQSPNERVTSSAASLHPHCPFHQCRGAGGGGSAWQIACKLEKHTKFNFFCTTFTTVFKICLYASSFDSSVCPHKIFWWHFANSSKLLKIVNELDFTSFKFSAIKWFFKSLEESAKCHQKFLCGHTDESKCLAYRHFLKAVVKVVEEKFSFLYFS